jgi:hypothetical protein
MHRKRTISQMLDAIETVTASCAGLSQSEQMGVSSFSVQ